MRITDLEAFLVAVPFRAPLNSAFGISYPARVRVIIRLHTDTGLIGIGETGPSPLHPFSRDALLNRFTRTVKAAVVGESPFDIEWLRRKLMHAPDAVAVELACWDIMAQAAGVPLYRLLGGAGHCERVPVAAYCFFRMPGPDGSGAVSLDNFVDHCLQVQAAGGFSVLKLKLGANHPMHEIPLIKQLRDIVGRDIELRIDPNGSWSLATALRVVKQLEDVDLQYVEEPIRAAGPGDSTTATSVLRRLRASTSTPIAADHCYRIDLLAQLIRDDAADVVLADVFGSGGIAPTMHFCRTASSFGLGVALHSGAELCIGQIAKVHIHAALPEAITYAQDAIYPEYVDGILEGGKLPIQDGHMAVPQSPGFGVTLDESRLAKWELTEARHRELDEFWAATKAAIGVTYPSSDLLMRHY
ncbi:MAG: mandelate racemase/muconate lactonizing enzyme family protein [Anaerolineae bacterium]|nr:mandelate racemase/muconate lactonizing enzyme family protein [Anaerolineae bacterium]